MHPGFPVTRMSIFGLLNLFHLTIQDLHREFILRDVIDPGTATTLIRAFHLYKIYAWEWLLATFEAWI